MNYLRSFRLKDSSSPNLIDSGAVYLCKLTVLIGARIRASGRRKHTKPKEGTPILKIVLRRNRNEVRE
jgi:hypothetical protein